MVYEKKIDLSTYMTKKEQEKADEEDHSMRILKKTVRSFRLVELHDLWNETMSCARALMDYRYEYQLLDIEFSRRDLAIRDISADIFERLLAVRSAPAGRVSGVTERNAKEAAKLMSDRTMALMTVHKKKLIAYEDARVRASGGIVPRTIGAGRPGSRASQRLLGRGRQSPSPPGHSRKLHGKSGSPKPGTPAKESAGPEQSTKGSQKSVRPGSQREPQGSRPGSTTRPLTATGSAPGPAVRAGAGAGAGGELTGAASRALDAANDPDWARNFRHPLTPAARKSAEIFFEQIYSGLPEQYEGLMTYDKKEKEIDPLLVALRKHSYKQEEEISMSMLLSEILSEPLIKLYKHLFPPHSKDNRIVAEKQRKLREEWNKRSILEKIKPLAQDAKDLVHRLAYW
jgi:hypothetical protein